MNEMKGWHLAQVGKLATLLASAAAVQPAYLTYGIHQPFIVIWRGSFSMIQTQLYNHFDPIMFETPFL